MDHQELIISALLKAGFSVAVKETYDGIKSIIKDHSDRVTLISTEKELEKHLISEIRKTSIWAYDDLFKNHKGHTDISSRYVHLDLLLEPRREQTNKVQLSRKLPLRDIILANKNNTVILGQPGSGKTTSVKYIVNSILHNSDFLNDIYKIPIVIRLRQLNESNSTLNKYQEGGIFERLSLIFGLKTRINYKKTKDSAEKTKEDIEDDKKLRTLIKNQIIPNILDNQKILLILDGFDEIVDDKIKDLVVSEIKELRESLNCVNFILTSRSADYKIKLEKTDVYEISELNEKQIKEFALKWFENNNSTKKFLKELSIKKHCKDFCSRPLLLTHLAQIYSQTNEIPDKPNTIYQRIVQIALKEWNEQQGIKRKTKYSTFTIERKEDFLSNMAFKLTIKYGKQAFSKTELIPIYRELNKKFKELPIDEVENVVEEIETHNGLIIKSGFDSFEFSHLTIQEYFVAYYIIRIGNIKRLKYADLIKVPNELAIAVALSSEPSTYLRDLLADIIYKDDVDLNFSDKFFNRLKLERPDFECDVIINVVLLDIYTEICTSIIGLSKNSNQFLSNYSQKALILKKMITRKDNLEKVICTVCGNNVVFEIKDYYEIDNQIFTAQGCFFISLQNIIVTNDFDFPRNLYWSKELYDTEAFTKKIKKQAGN